ncbi:hypothetical protein FW764_18235 [Pseudomonas sp. 1152_12]
MVRTWVCRSNTGGNERGLNVGAGLPAMRATRFFSDTEAMLSQASQLPHWTVVGLMIFTEQNSR